MKKLLVPVLVPVLVLCCVGVRGATPLEEMVALPSAQAGRTVSLSGYTASGDGGGGMFTIIADDGRTVDNGIVFRSTVRTNLLFVRQQVDYVDIRWFGAATSAADNATAIQAAIDAAPANAPIMIPSGVWNVSNVDIARDTSILSWPGAKLFHVASTSNSMITASATNTLRLRINGPTLDGNWQNRNAFRTNAINQSSIVAVQHHNTILQVVDTVFTNSQRAAIRAAGALYVDNSQFYNCATNSGDGNGTPGDTYVIFAQPTGYADDLTLSITDCYAIGHTGWDTNLVYRAAHGFFVTEQANEVDTTLNTNRYTVTIKGNFLVGLGGWLSASEGGAIEIYNGATDPVITDNHVYVYAQSGIKVQRAPNAIIENNVVAWGFNNYTGDGGAYQGVSDAIVFAPNAREGYAPFTGARAGEVWKTASIKNNVVYCFEQTAVYVTGQDVTIEGNIFDTRIPQTGVAPPATIAIVKPAGATYAPDNIRINGNTFKNMPNYAVAATGAYTNLWIIGNSFLCGSSSNTYGIFVIEDVSNLRFMGNYGSLSVDNDASFLSLSSTTNVLIYHNYLDLNSGSATAVSLGDAATQAEVTELDNSWQLGQYRRSQNALTSFEVANLFSTNTLGGASLRMRSIDSGGGMAAYPSMYANVAAADRVVIYNDSTADGVLVDLYNATDDFRVDVATTNHFYVARTASRVFGTDPYPFFIDTSNDSVLMAFKSANGTTRFSLGYAAGYPGVSLYNAAGTDVNVHVADTGEVTLRSDLTVPGTVDANVLQLTNVTPSRILATDANGYVTNLAAATGTGAPVLATGPTFTQEITASAYDYNAPVTLTHADGGLTLDLGATNRTALTTLTGAVTYAFANLSGSKVLTYNLYISNVQATNCAFTFPSGTTVMGIAGYQTAGKRGRLTVEYWPGVSTNVFYSESQ